MLWFCFYILKEKRLFLIAMRSFFCMARQMHVIFYFEILLGHESTQ